MKKKLKSSLVKAPSKKKIVAKKVATKPLVSKKMPIKKKVAAKPKQIKIAKRKTSRFSFSKTFGISVLVVVSLFAALSLKPSIEHDVLSASTSTEPPLAPTKLVAKVKNSTVTLTWTDTSLFTADKYVVYRYDSASGKYVVAPKNQITDEGSAKYVSSQNDSGRTYLYKIGGVRLYYASGETVPVEAQGPLSQPISVKIPIIKAPKTPTNLKASVKNSQISFTWSGSADGFTIEKYDSLSNKYISETSGATLTALKFSKMAYEPGKTYKFRVGAYNNVYSSGVIKDVLESDGYAKISVSVPAAKAPTAPTGLKATTSGGVVELTWANPSQYKKTGAVTVDYNGADGYRIMIFDTGTKAWVDLAPKYIDYKSSRVVSITGQNSGETKQYKIMAYKKIYSEDTLEISNLYGPYSKFVSVTMP